MTEKNKTLTREEMDKYHQDLLQRIRDSEEPIKVTGLIGNLGIAALPATVGDVSGFAEVQNEIDELRAKMVKLIKTTSCSSVETADAHLAKAINALEDYFDWAGCE